MIIKDLTPYANDGKYTNTYWNNGRINTVTWVTGTTTNTATYDINALGQRVRKATPSSVVGTRRFMYDEAGRLAGEYDSAGKLVQETVWLGDVPVATLRPKSGSTTTPIAIDIFYVHADHLGTPRVITRPTDNKVVWSWENTEAFGNNLPDENPSALGAFKYNLRMLGQYWDQETGAFYNYFRDYDPSVGRYIQSDPIGLDGGLTTYSYVTDNPVARTDRSGLVANGCGDEGLRSRLIPDNPFGFSFKGCCDLHDDCYDDCKNKPTKFECDFRFWNCMTNKCKKYSAGALRSLCEWAAQRYAGAVGNFGENAFNNARKNCTGPYYNSK